MSDVLEGLTVVVSEVRDRLSVNKRAAHNLMWRGLILKDVEVEQQYRVKISNMFAALEISEL
jgi:hypothetical protein